MQDLKIALLQTSLLWENPEQNRLKLANKINAIHNPVDLIVLPEMFTTGFSMKPEVFAETYGGPTLQWLKQMSVQTNAAICGSVMTETNGTYVNRLIWVTPDNDPVWYDKRHLFRMGEEQQHYTAGNTALHVQWKGWNIYPLICYDLRFPVWCRTTQTDLMLFVANWPERRREHWMKLLEARAIENQCYVAGVNRVGEDGNDVYHSGDSQVVDPRGNRICYAEYEETILTEELSYKSLHNYRKSFPAWMDADAFDLNT